ncbi:MAG: hypothetical protein ISQ18_00965 [Candidatus Micropelagos sp.]|nr:hypothetical protein [Candidatus Micropelagos sp.]
MTPTIQFDDFLLTFEHSLERVLSSASNSSSSPNDSSTGTSGINHSEIENTIKELGAVLDEHLPQQIAAISSGEVSLTTEQVDRLKDNLKQLEKLEIMAQSRLAWVNSLGNEMADWVDKLDGPRKD